MGNLANSIKTTAIITVTRKDGTVETYYSDETVVPMTEERKKFLEEQKKKQKSQAKISVKTDSVVNKEEAK